MTRIRRTLGRHGRRAASWGVSRLPMRWRDEIIARAADVIDVVASTMPDPIPPGVADAHKRLLADIWAQDTADSLRWAIALRDRLTNHHNGGTD